MEGMLNEIHGEGRSKGVEAVVENLVEKKYFAKLGQQLGSSLTEGATDISPEQRAELEATIDGAVTVAFMRAGQGVRNELSPEIRRMVKRDIIDALAEGLRGDVADSLEMTIDRIVSRAGYSLTRTLQDEELQIALSELIREAMYSAIREGRGYTPGIGETLEAAITENMLDPVEHSIGGLADTIAAKVDESARRTEKTLHGIISALVLILGVLAVMVFVTRRQLVRQQVKTSVVREDLRSVDAALQILDDATRAEVRGKMEEYWESRGSRPEDMVDKQAIDQDNDNFRRS
jgi:hypothetical protein